MKEIFCAVATKCSLNFDQMTTKPVPSEMEHESSSGIQFTDLGAGVSSLIV